jgi:hypothetical protein
MVHFSALQQALRKYLEDITSIGSGLKSNSEAKECGTSLIVFQHNR